MKFNMEVKVKIAELKWRRPCKRHWERKRRLGRWNKPCENWPKKYRAGVTESDRRAGRKISCACKPVPVGQAAEPLGKREAVGVERVWQKSAMCGDIICAQHCQLRAISLR